MAEPAATPEPKVKVFISYSRKDLAFAERILAALEARGLAPKLDTRDLPKLEDWRRELLDFIRTADAVVFIVSPNSVSSQVCSWEVEQVATLSKRLAPIVLERVPDDRIPAEIAKINYLFFDPPNDFEAQADALAAALQTDLDWLKEHTRLGELAHRWDERRRPAGRTLRGQDLEDAERWIASRPRGAPQPTDLHKQLVSESRRAATRRLRLSVAGALAVGILAVALAVFAFVEQRAAEASRANAVRVLATSDFQRGTTLLQGDETTPEGMAFLARALRRGEDRRALTRLWTLLQQREFWFPAAEVVRPGGGPGSAAAAARAFPPAVSAAIKERFGTLTVDGKQETAEFVSVSGDGRRVFTAVGSVAAATSVQYRVWESDGTPVTPWLTPEYSGDTYVYETRGFLSFDGRYLALEVEGWRETAYLEIFDLAAGKRIGGPLAASGAQPHTQSIAFSHVQFAERPPERPGADREVVLLAASPKGDATVFVVDEDRVSPSTTNRHAEPIVFAALDAAGEWLMSSAADGTVRVSRVSDGRPVGHVLQLPSAATSIERDGAQGLALTLDNGERRNFSWRAPARIPLPSDLAVKDEPTSCKKWDEERQFRPDGVKSLLTAYGEVTRVGTRQLGVGKDGGRRATSPMFGADIVLACLGETGETLAVTTKDFTTEVWAADFSRRFGIPIVESRVFGERDKPGTTDVTIPSADGSAAAIQSFLWIPPNLARRWYSYWDLATAAPLMDRLHFEDDSSSDRAVQSVRMDARDRFLLLVNEEKGRADPIVSLQVAAPASAVAWLADFAEAIAGVALNDDGILMPVADRRARLVRGVDAIAALTAATAPGR
jgi:TIR domain